MNPWLNFFRKQWDVFQSFDTNGKFFYLALMPIWVPIAIVFLILQSLVLYAFYKAKARREITERMAPDLAEVQHTRSWREQHQQREQLKAQPRPTTNTLYGGRAPTEKPLRDN